MGITCCSYRPDVELGLAATGLAAWSAGAFMGRATSFSGSASRARASAARRRPSGAGFGTARAGSFMGGAGCTRSFVGRSGACSGSTTGRAREASLPDGAVVEPAGSGMGPSEARRLARPGAVVERLGSAIARRGRASADGRAVVGGAWRSSRAQVRVMERTGRAGVGHAEDRRAGRPGGTFVGSAGGAPGRPVGRSSVEPARRGDPGACARTS